MFCSADGKVLSAERSLNALRRALKYMALFVVASAEAEAVVFSLLSNPKKMINFAEILRLCLQKRSSERNLRVYGVKY